MTFTAPIGTEAERAEANIWSGRWFDATGHSTSYPQGFHTGADLNLNYPHYNLDAHSKVYAMGDGKVIYAKLFSTTDWGKIIVIALMGFVSGNLCSAVMLMLKISMFL